jgi:hypothetical protein
MSDVKDVEVIDKTGDITARVVDSWNDMQRMAQAFARSALVPAHLKGKFEDVLVILQMAKELDIPPMQAINGISVIQGKPCVSPELQIALVRSKCPEGVIRITVDETSLTASCFAAPAKDRLDEGFTSTWNMARAKAMGLASKDNYLKQPLTMLKWRAVGEALRTIFPHVTKGLYNSEEAVDLGGPHDSKPAPSFKEIFKAKAEVVQTGDPEPDLPQVSGLEVEQ